jgi:hypothetical protein
MPQVGSYKKIERNTKMNRAISKKIGILSIFCIAIMTFALSLPLTCYGAEYSMGINFSPNIINIASQRVGEIRVFTDMRYSAFVTNGDSVFIYFNGSDTVENIRATRDNWGNLILKFNLEDLLALESFLVTDDFNDVEVVVVMNNGDEYAGLDEVYLADKKAP